MLQLRFVLSRKILLLFSLLPILLWAWLDHQPKSSLPPRSPINICTLPFDHLPPASSEAERQAIAIRFSPVIVQETRDRFRDYLTQVTDHTVLSQQKRSATPPPAYIYDAV